MGVEREALRRVLIPWEDTRLRIPDNSRVKDPFDIPLSELKLHPVKFSKRQIIYTVDDSLHCLLLLWSGRVDVYRDSPSGTRVLYERMDAKTVFDEDFRLGFHVSSAVARTPSEVVFIPQSFLPEVHRVVPAFDRAAQTVFAQRRRAYMDRIEWQRRTVAERVVHFCFFNADSCHMLVSMTKEEIAQYIGMARESVSKVMGRLFELGFIKKMGSGQKPEIELVELDELRRVESGDLKLFASGGNSDIDTGSK